MKSTEEILEESLKGFDEKFSKEQFPILFHKCEEWNDADWLIDGHAIVELKKVRRYMLSQLSQMKKAAEREENNAWINGRRCENCGREKFMSHIWSTCEDCE